MVPQLLMLRCDLNSKLQMAVDTTRSQWALPDLHNHKQSTTHQRTHHHKHTTNTQPQTQPETHNAQPPTHNKQHTTTNTQTQKRKHKNTTTNNTRNTTSNTTTSSATGLGHLVYASGMGVSFCCFGLCRCKGRRTQANITFVSLWIHGTWWLENVGDSFM